MLGGISPYSSLELMLSTCRNVRFPMAGEMVPASPRRGRLSATTCIGFLRLHVTPSQLLQRLVLPFQEARTPELLSPALKASSAASSLAAVVIIRMESREGCRLQL